MLSDINLGENGHLIFKNIPAGTEIGIDYHSWYVGPRFSGISNIPPGFHFIFFSTVDRRNPEQQSPRTGFFLYVKKGDIFVKYYDLEKEDLRDDNDDDAKSKEDLSTDLKEVGQYLAPYPAKECQKWSSIVSYISEDDIQRVQPICGKINSMTAVPLSTAGYKKKSSLDFDSRLPHLENEETVLRFSKIPNDFPKDISLADKTKYSLDSSHFLEEFSKQLKNGYRGILAELQLTFICFLIGQVYDCFDHWKALVTLFTNCQESIETHSKLFMEFIDVVRMQIDEIPEDFFVDIVAQNNFVLKAFQNFFQNTATLPNINGCLVQKISILRGELEKKFQFTFVEEDDDEMPVIVEL